MKTVSELVAEFLNVPPKVIDNLPEDLKNKLKIAIENDDYIKVHSLGYEIKIV